MSFVNCSYPTIFMQNTGEKYVNGTKKNANSEKKCSRSAKFLCRIIGQIKKSWKELFTAAA